MSDETLLLLGCAVSFLALAGAYVGVRERFLERAIARNERRLRAPVPAPAVARRAPPRARA
jgi:hypothetical protein